MPVQPGACSLHTKTLAAALHPPLLHACGNAARPADEMLLIGSAVPATPAPPDACRGCVGKNRWPDPLGLHAADTDAPAKTAVALPASTDPETGGGALCSTYPDRQRKTPLSVAIPPQSCETLSRGLRLLSLGCILHLLLMFSSEPGYTLFAFTHNSLHHVARLRSQAQSKADTQPQPHPALLRFSAIRSQCFMLAALCLF